MILHCTFLKTSRIYFTLQLTSESDPENKKREIHE